MLRALALGLFVSLASVAFGDIVITEWMYNGLGTDNKGEFVEFTNTGPDPVDMTGWSYDDDSRVPGTISLSALGVVAPGQSVILTDETAADFAAIWGLSGVVIVGENTANLGRNDEINLYDAGGNLVDRLTYGDQNFPGTVRTQNKSCNIPAADYGYTEVQTNWGLAADGDAYGSRVSTRGEVGSPGRIVGYARSDLDRDGDVDMTDFGIFVHCMTGPSLSYDPLPSGCALTPDGEGYIAADSDKDGDVDLVDFEVLQLCYGGEGNPVDPSCGSASQEPGETQIILNGTSITVIGDGVTVGGTKATITSQGVYTVTGSLADGQIAVNTPDPGPVEIVFDGINISNSTSACINVISAAHTKIILADQTANSLSDASAYVYDDPEQDEPNAALFSDDPMTISGTGSLTVHGNYNDAIASKDELLITGGTITVFSVDDGIRGKDYLLIQDGNITMTVAGDGLKSDNEGGAGLGYIMIQGGSFNITAGGDGIAAETDVVITGGDFTIVCGGGHAATIPEDLSAKGIKGQASVTIDTGVFDIDAADDGIHSNADVTINGGTFTIATADDGIHADATVEINDGTITVTTSYEGIEGSDIIINNGTIRVTSTDDGINGAGGADGSGGWPPPPGNHQLTINGGYIAVYASGDGIDVNGTIVMTGGTVIVHGPTSSMDSPIDYDVSFNISGGLLVAAGSAQMAQAPSTTSTQRSVKITYSTTKAAGTLAHIRKTSGGDHIVTFAPSKQYRSLVVSSPLFTAGLSCGLYRGGTCSGTVTDGLYEGGTYSGGAGPTTFTTSGIVTNVNNAP